MTQYIDKATIVTEIEKRLRKYEKEYEELAHYEIWATAKTIEPKIKELKNFLSFLNTLEVKEADLDKEIREEYLKRRYYYGKDNMLVILNEPQFNDIAKYFFELGLKAKGENVWLNI